MDNAIKCFAHSRSPTNIQCFKSVIGKNLVDQYTKQQNEILDKNMIAYLNCLITKFKQNTHLVGIDMDMDKKGTIISNICSASISAYPTILAIDEALKNILNLN